MYETQHRPNTCDARGKPGAACGSYGDARCTHIDIEGCPNCGSALKIIAAIEDPPAIVKILSHLGLPTRAASQRFDLFQTT